LEIKTANLKELSDTKESDYFFNMKQKALQEAKTYNISETSKLKAEANIKEKQFQRDTRIETSKMETEAVEVENKNKEAVFISIMNLNLTKIESEKTTQQKKIIKH